MVYDIPYGDKLSKNTDALGQYWSGIQGMSSDIKEGHLSLFRAAQTAFCSDINNYLLTAGDKTCKDWDTSQTLGKEWCSEGDNMTEDSQSVCTKQILGEDNYNTLASQYCVSNPDKEFCKCYNVVNYETVCANRPTSVGCAKAKEVYDKYIGFNIPDPNVYLPCGDACKGVNNYQPPGYKDGCDGTINACIHVDRDW